MQDNNTQSNIILKHYETLPTEVRDLIDFNISDVVIDDISDEFHLTQQQRISLENQVLLVLLFFLPSQGFGGRIMETLDIDTTLSKNIAKVIQEKLFYLIADILEETDKQLLLQAHTENVHTREIEEVEPVLLNDIIDTSIKTPEIPKTVTVSEEIKTEDFEKVTPIRTMETDAKRVHGYGAYRDKNPLPETKETESQEEPTHTSTQEDALAHRPITETPTYTADKDISSTPSS